MSSAGAMEDARMAEAVSLMMRFADATGLTSERPPRRYLWTDAFAVCNFLGLCRATGERLYGDLALRLIDQVHHQLGRHRPDDHGRSGWISGLPDKEGEAHPTCGGLRIGKPLPERSADEPIHPELEWHRDGQYFHYLTKWMHALDQAARWSGDVRFHAWARELAAVAHGAFAYGPPDRRRMAWKLSSDLSRPLVSSMGQHDPLDGWVTCAELEATALRFPSLAAPGLEEARADFGHMLHPAGLATSDPLGIGGLLVDAYRLVQLEPGHELVAQLLAAASAGLAEYLREGEWRASADRRLAFRELGLAIGLAGASRIGSDAAPDLPDAQARAWLSRLLAFRPLQAEIESFWLRGESRRAPTWLDHADINDVMLATALAPEGFLVLRPEPHPLRDVESPAAATP